MTEEYLYEEEESANEELKRVDHLIYVSLKYTRTVDVMRSIIERLVNALDLLISTLLDDMKEKGSVSDDEEIPAAPALKVEMVNKLFSSDEKIKEMTNFYSDLRKIIRAKYEKSGEFRKNVTMTAKLEEGIKEIKMDDLKEYYEKVKDYVHYVNDIIRGKKEDA